MAAKPSDTSGSSPETSRILVALSEWSLAPEPRCSERATPTRAARCLGPSGRQWWTVPCWPMWQWFRLGPYWWASQNQTTPADSLVFGARRESRRARLFVLAWTGPESTQPSMWPTSAWARVEPPLPGTTNCPISVRRVDRL